jgi:CheY-like chemotaxis protein
LLADDHAEILAQTRSVLAGESEIVGSVSNGLDLIDVAAPLDPDVVALAIIMPGLEAARRLKQGCGAQFVFLTVQKRWITRARNVDLVAQLVW